MAVKKFHIIDTTLRDGEQAPGVVFDLREKIAICELLDKTGITEIEIGTPAMGETEIHHIQCIGKQGFKFKTLSWCRALKTDVDAAYKSGTHGVHISFPVSDIHLNAMGKSKDWVTSSLKALVGYARDHFEYVTIGAQDASRTESLFLIEFIGLAEEMGVKRVRIADTVGILNPMTVYKLFRTLRKAYASISLEFHGHNDLGMATANTVTAFQAGADSASVTVNGLGERAGNAALEELMMALKISENCPLNYNTQYLNQLSQVVGCASGRPVSENKPITGNMVLRHESGIHTNILLKNRETYQIIKAQDIGRNEQEFVFGKHSGKAALRSFLHKHRLPISEGHCSNILSMVRERSAFLKRNITPDEILKIYKELNFI